MSGCRERGKEASGQQLRERKIEGSMKGLERRTKGVGRRRQGVTELLKKSGKGR